MPKDNLEGYKLQIINSLISLLKKDYEIKLGKRDFSVIEVYKSQSRDKWIEKTIAGSCGGDKFSDGWLRITANALREVLNKVEEEHV